MALWKLTAAAVIVLFGIVVVWRLTSNRTGTSPGLQPPPFDSEIVTSRLFIGSQTLDPPPPDLKPALDPAWAAEIAVATDARFPGSTARASRYQIRFGIHRLLSGEDPYVGKPVYVVSGDNLVLCPSTGYIGGRGSAVPRPGVAPTQVPVSCQWALTIHANTGDFIGMSFAPDVFCLSTPGRPC